MGYSTKTSAFPVLFEDDCSGPIQWYVGGQGGGTVAYDTSTAHGRGTRSIKMTTVPGGTPSPSAYAFTLLPYLSSSFLFSAYMYFGAGVTNGNAELGLWTIEIGREDGTNSTIFRVHYNPQTGAWTVDTSGGVVTVLSSFKLFDCTPPPSGGGLDRMWHYIEIAGDVSTKKYSYLRVDDAKQLAQYWSNNNAVTSPSSNSPRTHILTWIDQRASAATQLNFADSTVTTMSA